MNRPRPPESVGGPQGDAPGPTPPPLRLDGLLPLLPEAPILRPLVEQLLATSRPDRERRWSGSGELGTTGSRLVDSRALEATLPSVIEAEAARIARLYRRVAALARALAEGRSEEAVELLLLEAAALEVERGGGEAEPWYRAARLLAQPAGDPRGVEALRCAARCARARGALEEAAAAYEEAWREAVARELPRDAVISATGRGNVSVDRGEWEVAERWYRRALERASEPPLDGGRGAALRWPLAQNLAITRRELGDHDGAERWLRQGEHWAVEVEASAPEGKHGAVDVDASAPEGKRGAAEVEASAPEGKHWAAEVEASAPEVEPGAVEAERRGPEAESGTAPEAESGPGEAGRAAAESGPGTAEAKRRAAEGERTAPEAEPGTAEAERRAAEAEPRMSEAYRVELANGWGQLALARGEGALAIARFREALEHARDPRSRAAVAVNLGEALLAEGRALEAGEAAREAEVAALEGRLAGRLPEVYRLLAAVARARGEGDAFVFLERALALVREQGLPAVEEVRTLRAYAELRREDGEEDAALAALERARELEQAGVDMRRTDSEGRRRGEEPSGENQGEDR